MGGFIDHHPATELARVTVPVFALTDDRDLQLDAGVLGDIAAPVTGAPLETHRTPELNHLLRHTTGIHSPADYGSRFRTDQPLDLRALNALTAWTCTLLAMAA